MVEGTSFMGLGGPNLVKGAIGQAMDSESLGGASMHTQISGVAHYMAKDDADCLALIRRLFASCPRCADADTAPCRAKPADGLYDIMPEDHRLPYEVRKSSVGYWMQTTTSSFSPIMRPSFYAPMRDCRATRWRDRESARLRENSGGPRVGGIVYTESARKVAYFVENAERHRIPAALHSGRFRLHGGRGGGIGKVSSGQELRWWRPWHAPPCQSWC